MKKLLLPLILGFSLTNAQTIVSENFNSLTLGNLGTDFTATTAGQGGYYLYNGSATDYQIASIDATHGNSLRITSGNSYAATSNTSNRYVIKPITAVTPTSGNNIIKGSIDIYTGPATGDGKISVDLYDSTNGIGGIAYDYTTKKIVGKARLTLISTGVTSYYNITLTQTNTYPANTWVTLYFTYNKTTGAYSWITPEGTFTFSNSLYSVTSGLEPTEYDFISSTGSTNTVSNVTGVDNFNLQYTNQAALGVKEIKVVDNIEIGVYPNPTSDVLNITSDSKVNKVSVFDVSGRLMNVKLDGNKVDVRNLPLGTYLINIETKDGKTTEKFIKK